MSALKRFFKDTIIYGIAAVLPRVINFLLVRVHTDALPTNNYAENTNFYIWAALFSVLLTFGFETAFFRFYKSEKKKDSLVSTAFITVFLSALIFVTVVFSLSDFFINLFDFGQNPLQVKLFIGIMALDTLAVIPFAFLRAANRPIRYAIIKLINVGIIVCINLLFLKYIPEFLSEGKSIPQLLENTYNNNTHIVNFIFFANIIGSAISFLLLSPYLLKFKWTFDVLLFKKMISYSWPIAVAGVAYVINENLDKYLIKHLVGDAEMGIYAACYKLAIFMNLYIMAFRLGAEPFFFNHSDKKNAKETYAKILNYFIIVGSLVFVGIVVFIDILKRPFINENYWEAIIIVPVVLLANLFLGVYHNLAIWYKLTDKTRYAMLFSITGALITIILNLVLIPKIGFMASAWATLAAYGTMMVLSYFIGKKHYPVPYNLKKSGSYLIASIVISTTSFIYFRENYIVSVGFVFAFGFLIFYNEKKELMALIKRK